MTPAHETVHCQLWPTTAVPADLQALIPEWRRQCFPDSQPGQVVWRESDVALWAFAGTVPVSTLQIICHAVRVGDARSQTDLIDVGGIAGVMTPPHCQGRGYASAAMRHAANFLRAEWTVSFGLLGCHEHRVSFYERLGWRRLAAAFTFDQPGGLTRQRYPWVDVPMILPLNDSVPWPAGDTIDFNGLPW